MGLINLKHQYKCLIVSILAFFVYANTVQNDFAIDDAIVFSQNNFTKHGTAGIVDILTHDTFEGFFGKRGSGLIQGGRYRPLSLVTFAIEYDCWGLNPAYSHLVNTLLFALTCLLVFILLDFIARQLGNAEPIASWPFWAALLYAVHPIHTEAVANIKGRDEILSMLFSVAALWLVVKSMVKQNALLCILGGLSFFMALLSKENAITFVGIFLLTYGVFFQPSKRHFAAGLAAFVVPAAVFLLMRHHFAPTGILDESKEILNNPFARANFSQRYGTAIGAFLRYLFLLFVPLHLTHDYYFNQIAYSELWSPLPLLSILAAIGLVFFAVKAFSAHKIVTYGIGFFFITYAIVSNLLFSVGIILNERFLFMPSLGFCVLVAYGLDWLLAKQPQRSNLYLGALLAVLLLFSVRTIARNADWKDNLTLLTHDVEVSANSSKANTTFGGLLMEDLDKRKDTIGARQIQELALAHLQKALTIYPENGDAWLLLGNAYYKYFRNPTKAIEAYAKANAAKGGNFDALFNCAAVELDAKMPTLAIANFRKANMINPNQYKCLVNWAEAYSRANLPDSALVILNMALRNAREDAYLNHQIGVVYGRQKGQVNEALPWLQKAVELNPKAVDYWEDFAVANGMSRNFKAALEAAEMMSRLNPQSAAAYGLMSASYANMGDLKNAQRCQQIANQLSAGGGRNR